MTSSSSMSLSPSLKSSSMFSICVPAFRRWELHHAVNVCARAKEGEKKKDNWGYLQPGSKYLCSFYNNKPLWIVNERKWNSMGRKGGQGDTLIRQEVQGETRRESLTTCHTRRCGVGISVAKHFMHSYPTKSFKLKRQKTNQPSPILALSVWRCCH